MSRIVFDLPEEIAPVYKYHLAMTGKRQSKYLTELIAKDLTENQPELMKNIKKRSC